MRIQIETDDRIFDHGELKVVKSDGVEKSLDIKINIVIGEDVSEFKKELEELIKRWAI